MKKRGKLPGIPCTGPRWVGMMALLFTGVAQGADQPLSEEQSLREQIIEQTKRFEALKRQMADMDARLLDMQARLDKEKLRSTRATGSSQPRGNDGSFDLAQASQPRSQSGLFVVFIRWTSGLLKQAPGHWHRGTMAYPGC